VLRNKPLDMQLIQLLGKDARQSSEALASQLNVSSATVRRRVKKLIKSGVLRIVAVADPAKVGLPLAVVIALRVNPESSASVVNLLTSRPEIKWVSTTTGRFDLIALARFASTDELSEFVQTDLPKIGGIRNSETFVCLRVLKPPYTQI